MHRSFVNVAKTLIVAGLLSACGAAYCQGEEPASVGLGASRTPLGEGSYQVYSTFEDARCASGTGHLATLASEEWKVVPLKSGTRQYILAVMHDTRGGTASRTCRNLISFVPPPYYEYSLRQDPTDAQSCVIEIYDLDRGTPPPDLIVEDPQACPQ